jgi:hypothetical protein
LLHKFDGRGTELNADLDYVNYHADGSQLSPLYVYLADGSLNSADVMLNQTPSDINIYSIKTDFSHPLKGKARLDAGLKSSYVRNDNQTDWFMETGGSFIPDYSKTNHFIYGEHIRAMYANGLKEWKRWGVQGGLRIENVRASGHQLGNMAVRDSSFTKSYTTLFPSFFLSYKPDDNNTWILSYSQRIRRPGYQQLNPFLFYRDKYSYTAGNPRVNPAIINHIGLRYLYKHALSIALSYIRVNHNLLPVTEPSGTVFITRPENYGTNYQFAIVPSLMLTPLKSWDLNFILDSYYMADEGITNGQTIRQSIFTIGDMQLTNLFRFPGGWSGEIDGFYAGRHIGGISAEEPLWRIDAGIQKTMLKDKAMVVRLTVNDIFYSMKTKDKTVGLSQVMALHSSETDTRRIGISVSYRFRKDINTRKRNHTAGGAGDEQGRVGY